ncbi:MAG: putative manganese-dependent inorganic diphosphatase [Sphaerochaetaceae bacterium]|nr:putative manganese-dependent inorganic diphosphatase [Sphaerochaetaceae bacterium]
MKMTEKIFITGHRNPDMDSVCAAYGYAVLKNTVTKEKNYVAIRCGHLSDSLRKQFSTLGIEPPPYMRDVYPKVSDVMRTSEFTVDAEEPIYSLMRTFREDRPSVIPVTKNGEFYSLLSVDDITAWFLKDNSSDLPVYTFSLKNVDEVLPGHFIMKGRDNFGAYILAGAAGIEDFKNLIPMNCPAVVVMGKRKEHIEHAIKMQIPLLVVTTADYIEGIDFTGYTGSVYVTGIGTAEAIRRLRMATSVSELISEQGTGLQSNVLFDDARDLLSESKLRGLSVFEGEKWVGYVTRRCFLQKPSYKVILVDHNEMGQSIKGIETASVREIIDHHRLDAVKTTLPIFIDAEPLGSTCTIVTKLFERHGIAPDPVTAKVLLAGIISDTLILKSPTTTEIDRGAAEKLARIAGEPSVRQFGEKMFNQSESLSVRDPKKVVTSDFKTYNENGIKIGIGQCETPSVEDALLVTDKYLEMLDTVRTDSGLDWGMLMITDVLREHSILLSTVHSAERKLPYKLIKDNVYDMPGILSRKKQLLPEIVHVFE